MINSTNNNTGGNKKRVRVFVSGNVHGVTFRASTARKARGLELAGWVQNIDNGVEAVFEGNKDKIKEIIKWMRNGPKSAEVTNIDIREEIYRNTFTDFEIK